VGCLQIRLFGNLVVRRDNELLEPFPTRESENLFSFLVLNRGQLFQRDTLVRKLYSDECESAGRKRLRTAIWRIRSVIEPDGIETDTYISNSDRRIGFDTSTDYWLDIQHFETVMESVLKRPVRELDAEQARRLKAAVDLYHGDLLDGVFEDWCLWQQERLKLLLLTAIEKLMSYSAENRDWAIAILYAHELLRHDVLREHIHRDLMRFYYYSGDRPAALHQFDICANLLLAELDIEPMRETSRLRDEILSEIGSPPSHTLRKIARDAGLQELTQAAAYLDQARESLNTGILKSSEFSPAKHL